MPQAPKAAKPNCDVPGCGSLAVLCTDGTEKDVAITRVADPTPDDPERTTIKKLNRPSVKNLNVCGHHTNWPHSEDATAFTVTAAYKGRA